MRIHLTMFLAAMLTSIPLTAGASSGLAEPVRLRADGELIDVDVGHAAPFVYDFDDDGKRDLLVGQFGKGRLRIYRNAGTSEEPQFQDFEWFQAGGTTGKVPAG